MLIDVRTKKEYEEKHHENSVNIPVEEIATTNIELEKDAEIIIHCKSGMRASIAVKILKGKGFNNVKLLNNTGAF